ncbi:MAG: hypothetical protein SGILL_007009, partial [Bacillariaceae sp.]
MVLTRVARKRAAPDLPSGNGEGRERNISNDAVASATANSGNDVASSSNKGKVVEVDKDGFMYLKSLSPLSKKRKTCPLAKQDKSPIEVLPSDVLECVLGFVADPKMLLALTSTVK